MPPNVQAGAVVARDASRKDGAGEGEAATTRTFTWQEVAKHNTAESAWVIVNGGVYDVTRFLDQHPGGREMLLVSAGRECTDLFNSYHWWDKSKPLRMLERFRVGSLVGAPEFPAYAPDTRNFYGELSKRVRAYFEERKLHPKDPGPGLWRLAIIVAVFVTGYLIVNGLLLPELGFWPKAAVAVVFGIFQVMPLLHAMHDASHTAIGPNETWWKVVGRGCLDWLAGGSMMTWHHQHIMGHHVYTNLFHADPDVPYSASGDPRYLSKDHQVWAPMYRFQWLYLPVLYGLLAIATRVNDVKDTMISRTSGPVRVNMYSSPFLRFVVTKAVWAAWRIGVPLLVLGVPASTFWPLFAIAEAASGFWLAWNFEVSHVADTVLWPKESEAGSDPAKREVPVCWAEAQVRTSVDYGHNWWATWWSGALNYQIEHHLFPGISQYHYPAIAPIVQEVCREFGVSYRLEPSFWAAWTAHVRHLYEMGKAGKRVHLD